MPSVSYTQPLKSANRNALISESINATVPEKSYGYKGSNSAVHSCVTKNLKALFLAKYFRAGYIFTGKGLFLL